MTDTRDMAREALDTFWQELLEKDDRTSPAEFPEMALITREELADFVARAYLEAEERIEKQREEIERTKKVLREHHQWHLDCGEIGLQANDGEWVPIDNAGEYSDSLFCQRTAKALEGLPPDEAGPPPRGGMREWWWQQAVLQRRARHQAESELTSLRERCEGLEAEVNAASERARTIARMYPESSDGRNTFILLAEWIEERAAKRAAAAQCPPNQNSR